MSTIVAENLISFKELEQKNFKYVCELGCEITRIILESYDDELAASRDTRQYRDKGVYMNSMILLDMVIISVMSVGFLAPRMWVKNWERRFRMRG